MNLNLISAVLSVLIPACSAESGNAAAVSSSPSLAAEFSEDGQLLRLENRLTGEQLFFGKAEQFAFTTEDGEINSQNTILQSVRRTPTGLETTYRHPQFEITVAYELQPDNHFLQKKVRIRHLGGRPFTIKRCSLSRWVLGTHSGGLVPFQHGQCITYFLRQGEGGFFFGVHSGPAIGCLRKI